MVQRIKNPLPYIYEIHLFLVSGEDTHWILWTPTKIQLQTGAITFVWCFCATALIVRPNLKLDGCDKIIELDVKVQQRCACSSATMFFLGIVEGIKWKILIVVLNRYARSLRDKIKESIAYIHWLLKSLWVGWIARCLL